LTDRTFSVHYRGLESAIHQIPSGLPPGETLSLTLYSVFTCDPPNFPNCDLTVFADDTAHSDVSIEVQCLQNAVKLLQLYYSSWKIKINPSTEVHGTCPLLIWMFVVPLFLGLKALSTSVYFWTSSCFFFCEPYRVCPPEDRKNVQNFLFNSQ
jgi:hypothetical protein